MATKGTSKAGKKKVFEQLAGLTSQASRVRFLSRRRHLLSPVIVQRLDDAVTSLVRVDLRKARRLAEAAVTIADHLEDKGSRAYALRAKANALWFLGRNRQASELHEQAIRLFEEAGKPIEAGRALSSSIQSLILLGEYGRAYAAAEHARKIFSVAGDTVRLARLDINVGNIFHRQDRFHEALDCYERACSQLLPSKDAEGMIAALHNIALCRIMLNDSERAMRAYEQARELSLKRDMPLAVAQAEYNIAYLHYMRGAYDRAIAMLRAARKTAQDAGDAYHEALCQLDLSEIFLELNINQDAAELAHEAFRSFQKLKMRYEAGKSLCNSAIALGQQGQGFHALELFTQARAMFLKEGNQVWPSLIDLYQALVYFNEGRLPESRRYCLAALDFFRSSPLPGRAILCHLLLARLSLKMGDIEAARHECQTALADLAGIEAPILAHQAHLVMGQIEETVRNLPEAQHQYGIAREVLEDLRGALHGEELKISFMKNRLEVYENLVDLCLAGPEPAAMREAWTYIEMAKSRSLLELMGRRVHAVAANGGGSAGKAVLARRISELREQLNWYYHRIEVEQLGQVPASDDRLLELRDLAGKREREFIRLLRELPPAEAEAAGVETAPPASLEDVQSALGPHVTLVEYFRVRDRILAVIVTEDSLQAFPVTLAPRIAKVVRMMQFQFSKFRLDPAYIREFQAPLMEATQAHLQDLHRELLEPIRDHLKGRHLVIVPHELLHYVPFHALFDGRRYLVDSYTVSYAPSASIYVECRRKANVASGGSLLLGVPDKNTPSIQEELQSVAEVLPRPKVFLGSQASRQALEENGPRSRWIHIATHGFFRQDNPMFSGIRLGDTFLTLYDLYRLKLPAEQVTLSGCSTGMNVIAAGDELMGLMRGLLAAGARSLLLTLWDVNDTSTAEFMRAFYSRLFRSLDRSMALREAMLELRERYPHPYYWAPFILVGNVLP